MRISRGAGRLYDRGLLGMSPASPALAAAPRFVRIGLAGVTGLAFAALLVSLPGGGRPGGVTQAFARTPAAPVLAVSASGNDRTCSRGRASRPCLTFDRAYRLAYCGDTVQIAAGRYGAQNLHEVASRSSCLRNVVFRPAAGASVSVKSIAFGDDIGSTNAADRITLKNFAVRKRVDLWGDVNNVRLENINGGAFYIQGANEVLIKGGDWGPCDSSGPSECRTQSFITEDSRSSEQTQNVTIDGATFHDYVITGAGDHFECLFTTGGSNVTIRNSRFNNCRTYAIATGARDWAHYDNWVIENNRFGRTCCVTGVGDRQSAIMFGGDVGVSNLLIRFNTFISGQGVVQEGHLVGANNRVVANILTQTGCVRAIRYSGNLFDRGTCSADDRGGVYGYRFDGVRLRVDGQRGRAVQAAYEAVAQGMSLRRAARVLARGRRPSPPGGWNVRTLRELLADEVYLGHRLGRQSEHSALVSKARWRRVQRVLDGKASGRR
jgi:Recombinase